MIISPPKDLGPERKEKDKHVNKIWIKKNGGIANTYVAISLATRLMWWMGGYGTFWGVDLNNLYLYPLRL